MPGTFVRPVFIRTLTEAVAGTTAVTIFRPTTQVDVPLNVWMVPSRSAPITLWYWAADTSLHAFGSLAALKAGAARASEPAMAAVTMSFFNVVSPSSSGLPLEVPPSSRPDRCDDAGQEVIDDGPVRAHLGAAGSRTVGGRRLRRCLALGVRLGGTDR